MEQNGGKRALALLPGAKVMNKTILFYYRIWKYFSKFLSFQLAGDPILNFVLATVADSPVCLFLFLTLDRIGRRFTICLTHVTLGLSCIGK